MSKSQSQNPSNFIKKVYDMVTDNQNINQIAWSEDGKTIIIFNQNTFSNHTLPKYFKHNNYCSFVRQLNMYNFHKLKQSQHIICFQHQHFQKDNLQSFMKFRARLCLIKRKPEFKKSKQESQIKSSTSERKRQQIVVADNKKQNQMQSTKEYIQQHNIQIEQKQRRPSICQSSISISGQIGQPSPRRSIFGDLGSPRNYFSPINFDAFVCSYQNFLK